MDKSRIIELYKSGIPIDSIAKRCAAFEPSKGRKESANKNRAAELVDAVIYEYCMSEARKIVK